MTFETLKHSLWFSFKNVEHFFKLINITDWLIWIWSMLHTNWKSNNSLKFDILAWLKIVIVISKRKNIIALKFYFNSLDKVLNLHKNNKEYRYFDNNDNLLNPSCLAWWLGFPFFWKKISILEMELSGNLLRKPEFRDISGSNGNWNVYGLRDVNRKFFRFTEWKP